MCAICHTLIFVFLHGLLQTPLPTNLADEVQALAWNCTRVRFAPSDCTIIQSTVTVSSLWILLVSTTRINCSKIIKNKDWGRIHHHERVEQRKEPSPIWRHMKQNIAGNFVCRVIRFGRTYARLGSQQSTLIQFTCKYLDQSLFQIIYYIDSRKRSVCDRYSVR